MAVNVGQRLVGAVAERAFTAAPEALQPQWLERTWSGSFGRVAMQAVPRDVVSTITVGDGWMSGAARTSGDVRSAFTLRGGMFERMVTLYPDGRLNVLHDGMWLPPELRKSGFGTSFVEDSFARYAAAGVDDVTVHASNSVGPYTWAHWFDIDSDKVTAAGRLRDSARSITRLVERARRRGRITEEQYQQLAPRLFRGGRQVGGDTVTTIKQLAATPAGKGVLLEPEDGLTVTEHVQKARRLGVISRSEYEQLSPHLRRPHKPPPTREISSLRELSKYRVGKKLLADSRSWVTAWNGIRRLNPATPWWGATGSGAATQARAGVARTRAARDAGQAVGNAAAAVAALLPKAFSPSAAVATIEGQPIARGLRFVADRGAAVTTVSAGTKPELSATHALSVRAADDRVIGVVRLKLDVADDAATVAGYTIDGMSKTHRRAVQRALHGALQGLDVQRATNRAAGGVTHQLRRPATDARRLDSAAAEASHAGGSRPAISKRAEIGGPM